MPAHTSTESALAPAPAWAWIPCALAGVTTGACFWIPSLAPAAWVVPAVALYFIARRGRGCSWAFALGYAGAAYALAYTVRTGMDGVPIALTNTGLHLAATALHAPLFALALWTGARLPVPNALRPVAGAVCWAGAEWLTWAGTMAWPMLSLGAAQWRYPVLAQTASLGGPLLTSAIMMLFAGLLAAVALSHERRVQVANTAAAVVLLGGVVAYSLITPPAPADGAEVALVQSPRSTATSTERLQNALDLALAQAGDADLVVLPEGTAGNGFSTNKFKQQLCADAAQTLGAPLVVGAWFEEGDTRLPAAYLVDTDGQVADVAVKQRLVPLYEAATGAQAGTVAPPPGRTLSSGSADVEAGILVCFESMFPALAREAAHNTSLLTVITSDSSFGGQTPRLLHFGYGVMDAIATGRWFVQASTDGVTGAASPAGDVTLLESAEPGVLNVRVGQPHDTPYLHVGETWLAVAAGVVALTALTRSVVLQERKPQKKTFH